MDTLSLLFGLFVGFVISYLSFLLFNKSKSVPKSNFDELSKQLQEANSNIKIYEERFLNQKSANSALIADLQIKEDLIKLLQEKVNAQALQINNLEIIKDVLNEKLENQNKAIEEFRRTSQIEFENIANRILKAKADEFTATNKTNIEGLLKPLSLDIETFKKKVEEESKERFSLGEKVKDLVLQTNKVSEEANNLASALKGQSKKQGNWGEVILESILQKSGLVKDREYTVQEALKDEDGKKLQPDILVKLPDNRVVIIDSKVSLVAYDKFSATDVQEEQKVYLDEHLRSIYGHIDSLSGKQYDNLETSLDFTMMFIPIEPAYLVAIQGDQQLWSYAYSKRILLISPTNLIACLKLIADLWKRELQSKNAMEIVKRGELLYDKFVSFATTLEEIGKNLNKTQSSYSIAIAQLNSGSGHLVGQALKLKNLGLKSTKEIPGSLLGFDLENEEKVDEIKNAGM